MEITEQSWDINLQSNIHIYLPNGKIKCYNFICKNTNADISDIININGVTYKKVENDKIVQT